MSYSIYRTGKIIRIAGILATSMIVLMGCGERDTTEEMAYRQYGINCMDSGEYDKAVDAFQDALDVSTGGVTRLEIDICLYKAQAQFLSGDTEGALETYGALIEYDDNAKAYYGRGSLYLALEDSEKALNDFDSAIEAAPEDYELYIGIYETLANKGFKDKASNYLSKAVEIKGKSGYDLMEKGRIYHLMGDDESAKGNLEKAIDEGETKANYYMALMYLDQGEDTLAQTFFDEYLKTGEPGPEELGKIGESLMNTGEYQVAIGYFEAALKAEEVPNEQQLRKNTIIAYERMGDFDNAKKLMAEYIKDYPEDEAAIKDNTFLETR